MKSRILTPVQDASVSFIAAHAAPKPVSSATDFGTGKPSSNPSPTQPAQSPVPNLEHTMKPANSNHANRLTPADERPGIATTLFAFQRWLLALLLCLGAVSPLHAVPVVDNNAGTFTDNYADNGGMVSPNQVKIATAGTVSLISPHSTGEYTTVSIQPTSFDRWEELNVAGSYSAVGNLKVEILDVNGNLLLGPLSVNGAPINLNVLALNTTPVQAIKVRVSFSKPGSIGPTVHSLQVKWRPVSQLLLDMQGATSVLAGDNIVYSVRYSVNFVEARNLVVVAPLPSHAAGTMTYPTAYGQDDDVTYVTANKGGMHLPKSSPAIVMSGVTIPPNSVYWILGTVPEGTTDLLSVTVATKNGTLNLATVANRAHIYADNSPPLQSSPVVTTIHSEPSPFFDKQQGAAIFDVNGSLQTVEGTVNGFSIRVENRTGHGRETMYNTVVYDNLTDLVKVLHDNGGNGLADDLINISPAGGVFIPNYNPNNTGPFPAIVWNIGALPPGATFFGSFNAKLQANPPQTHYVNYACLISDQTTPVCDQINVRIGLDETPSGYFAKGDNASGTFQIKAATDDNPESAVPYGGTVSFALLGVNNSVVKLNDLVFLDMVPANTKFRSAWFNDPNLALSGAEIFYSTSTGFPNRNTPPPLDHTQAVLGDLDAGANNYWKNYVLNPPANPKDVTWVAYYIPQLDSIHLPNLGTPALPPSTPITTAIGYLEVDVFSPVNQCTDTSLLNLGVFQVYETTDLSGVQSLIPGGPLSATDEEEVIAKGYMGRLFVAGYSSISPDPIQLPSLNTTYSVTLRNSSEPTSDALANVQVTLQLSQVPINGVMQWPSVQSISPSGSYLGGGKVLVTLGLMPVGASQTIDVKLGFPAGILDQTEFTVDMKGVGSDDKCGTSTVTDKTRARIHSSPTLRVRKSTDADLIASGDSYLYELDYMNVGTGPSTGTWIMERVPAKTVLVKAYGNPNITAVYFSTINNLPPAGLTPLDPFTTSDLPPASSSFVPGVRNLTDDSWTPSGSVSPSDVYWVAWDVDDAALNPPQLLINTLRHVRFEVKNDHNGQNPGTLGSPDGTLLFNAAAIFSSELQQAIGNQVITKIDNDPSILVNKTGPSEVEAGETFDWVVSYHNNTLRTPDETAIVEDNLPPGIVFVEATHSWNQKAADKGAPGGINTLPMPQEFIRVISNNDGSTKVIFNIAGPGGYRGIGPLNGLEGGTITLKVFALRGTPSGSTRLNNACGTATRGGDTFTSCASHEVTVFRPDLHLLKRAYPLEVLSGDTLTYTLTLANHGSIAARNVEITDLLPPGVSYVPGTLSVLPADYSLGAPSISGQKLTWDVANGNAITHTGLPAGRVPRTSGDITIQFDARVAASVPACTTLNNTAQTKTDSAEDEVYPNIASASAKVPPSELAVAMSDPPLSLPGSRATWNLTWVNQSAQSASGVYLIQTLPNTDADTDSDVTFVSIVKPVTVDVYYHAGPIPSVPAFNPADPLNAVNGWTDTPGSKVNRIALRVGDMAGNSSSFTAQVSVNLIDPKGAGGVPELPQAGACFSSSVVIHQAVPLCEDTANNTATARVCTPSLDLALTKTGSMEGNNPGIAPGQPITYTLAIENNGTVNAYGVSVIDNLPATLLPGSPMDDFSVVNLVDRQGRSMRPVDLSGNPIADAVPVTREISGGNITWYLGSRTPSDPFYYQKVGLRPDHVCSFRLNVTVAGSVPDGAEVCNPASVAAAIGTEERLDNNHDQSCVLVRRADVFATKTGVSSSGSSESAEFGEEITYTIRYGNLGGIDAHDVVINEIVPTGTALLSVNAPYGSIVTYSPDRANATSFSVKFDTLPAVTSSLGASQGTNQSGTNARPSLQIQRAGNNNATITWPVSFEGWVLETTGLLNEPILWQPELTPVTQFPGGMQGITVPMNKMAAYYRLRRGVSWTDITFKVRVDAERCGEPAPIENVVTISTTTPEKRVDNNSASHTMFIRLTDLQVQCDISAAAILENEILTHTLNWLVDGPQTAPDAYLQVALPGDANGLAEVTLESVPTVAGVGVYYHTDSTLTPPLFDAKNPAANGWAPWTTGSLNINHLAFLLGDLTPGSGGTIHYTTKVKIGSSGRTLCFGVTGTSARRDKNCDNNFSSCCATVGHWPNVYIQKSSPGCVHPGELVTFQITVGNNGNGPAANVVVADVLPPELTFDHAVPAPTGAGPTWNNLGATPGTLSAGETRVITVVARLANDCTLVGRAPVNVATITTTSEQANVADDYARAKLNCIILDFVSLSGRVYHDLNANCLREPGEVGIKDVTITLTGTVPCGSPVTFTTVTDQNGEYSFTGLYPGDYTITETQPANWVSVGDVVGTLGGINSSPLDDKLGAITLLGGQNGLEYNFCESEPSHCTQITDERLECATNGLGNLTYSFTVQNRTPDLVKYLTFTSLSDCLSSEIIALPTALAGGVSTRVSVDLDASAGCGTNFCFLVGLHNARLQECCSIERCLPNPLVPRLVCPPDLIVECQGSGGTPVHYPAMTASVCSGSLAVVCTPASGSLFLPGTTIVACHAGESPTCSFTVTVLDRTPPSIVCPPNIVVNCAGALGSAVPFAVSATDNCDGNVTVTCTRASNSLFAPGTTPVTCTATDDGGNTSTCSFTVTVHSDMAPPTIAGCQNITVNASSGQTSAAVNYNVTATDDSAGIVTLACTPPSGSTFACGTRTVTCRATDACGKTSLCSFTVTVNCGKGDLMVEDTPYNYTGAPDLGRESDPNMAGQNMWMSRGIWIHENFDAPAGTYLSHQNPRYGQTNGVFVNVKNRGTAPLAGAKLEVWFANASMGLSWIGDWQPLGTYDLPGINAADSFIASLPWRPPGTGHYCLLARIISVEDPMFMPEGSNVGVNTRMNNNIAWRNVNVADCLHTPAKKVEVRTRNIGKKTAPGAGMFVAASADLTSTNPVTFVFTASEDFLATGGEAVLDLGPLFARWQSTGANGTNIVATNGTQVRFTGSPARIRDIPMGEGEPALMNLTMAAAEPMPGAGTKRLYDLALMQEIDGEMVGGVNYELVARAQDTDTDGDGIPDVTDPDDDGDGVPDANDPDPLGRPDCDPVTLTLTRTAGGVGLNWAGLGYRLQTTTALDQPWTDLPGVTSPAQLPANAPQQYFRLVCSDGLSCSISVVGYVNTTLQSSPSGSATNLIANPLNGTNNNLNTILPLPDGHGGTTILRFNPATATYHEPIQFIDGFGWYSADPGENYTLNPGEGFFIMPTGSNALTVTFIGEVPQGSFTNTLPVGWSIKSSVVPQAGSLNSLGFPTGDGDMVITFNSATQQFDEPYLYADGFGWVLANSGDPVPAGPVIPVGKGFMVFKTTAAAWARTFHIECGGCLAPSITAQPQGRTVTANACVTFSVGTVGTAPFAYQWFKNGQAIPGANAASLTQCPVTLADNGGTYFVSVTNACGSVTSATAILAVVVDTTPPTLVSITPNCASNHLTVTFSELLNSTTAIEVASYQLTGGATVQSAVLAADGRTVELFTDPLASGVSYTLTVDSLQDLAGNAIASNTQRTFTCPTPVSH